MSAAHQKTLSSRTFEHPLRRLLRKEVVARRRVLHPLGLAGRAAGVEDEEERFAVQGRGGAIRRGVGDQLVPAKVAARLHGDLRPGPLQDDALLDAGGAGQRRVGGLFQRHSPAVTPGAVGGDQQLRPCVVVALGERFGGKAAGDHAVDGADARAGQHGDCRLGDQRHVDRRDVALVHAQPPQDVGETAHFGVELAIGEAADLAGLALPDQGDLLAAVGQVGVEAVVGNIRLTADEPLGKGRVPAKDLVIRREPVQFPRQSRRKALRIGGGLLAHPLIFGQRANPGFGGKLRRRRKETPLLHHVDNLTGLPHRHACLLAWGGTGVQPVFGGSTGETPAPPILQPSAPSRRTWTCKAPNIRVIASSFLSMKGTLSRIIARRSLLA